MNKFVTLIHTSNAIMETNFVGINHWREKIIFVLNLFRKRLFAYHKDKNKNEIFA